MKGSLLHLMVLRKLGYRGSRAAKKRILFNILLISLVVASLVFAQIFVVSMSRGIADKYALLGNGHLQIHEHTGLELGPIEGLLDTQLVAQSHALIYSPEANKMVRLKGVGSEYFNEMRLEQLSMGTPEAGQATNLPQILISTTLAEELGVTVNDRVALMLVSQNSIRPQLCVIHNLYDSGYQELDANLVFCDYELVHRLFGGKEETYYELLVEQSRMQSIKGDLQMQGYSVTSWDEENYSVATNLNTSRQAVLGVMVVVAILCGYFISELSRELVEDDKHKIAMLTLLGARRVFIRKVYFSTVMLVTLVSILAGTMAGMLLASNLGPLLSYIADKSIPSLSYYLLDFSISIPASDILSIILVLLFVSMISVQWSLRRVKVIEPLSCTHFD
ncbi:MULTISPECIES: FtsX-like permease family protein [Sphaerochaeta]|uniref:ABC transporter permease n=1 Tax=Sphaerochaeta TaxID=399320 RepID=UPI001D69808F|nr:MULTISPECIES: FtsX-like permease family protein [Sphaerochaeta]NCC57342.1 ABC transporter permease [Synergistales bacterium]MDD3423387.1 FtsX-like permease family protein [Sphaerochaeta sp.]MDD3455327.1 FtsX-like permease family protein [Sphaerochaeta sp.]MDD4036800.1 FtsX-like permease family protein [Sphaerochaeta sp.]MDD4450128.1 FtsX-like permease family protein [Sphaerochaeta sp.]